jgi:hypothetical protein
MDSCSVCLTPEIPEGSRCSTDCGHMYCKECLDRWFDRGNRSCPLCRTDIQYIQQGENNYRIVLKRIRAQGANLNRERYMYIHLRFYKCIQISFIAMTGLIIFGLSNSYLNHLDRNELVRDYKVCARNLANHERVIQIINAEATSVRVSMNQESKWCSIPDYFLSLCGY